MILAYSEYTAQSEPRSDNTDAYDQDSRYFPYQSSKFVVVEVYPGCENNRRGRQMMGLSQILDVTKPIALSC